MGGLRRRANYVASAICLAALAALAVALSGDRLDSAQGQESGPSGPTAYDLTAPPPEAKPVPFTAAERSRIESRLDRLKALRTSPDHKRKRAREKRLFSHQNRSEAKALLQDKLPEIAAAHPRYPDGMSEGDRVIDYMGDYAAKVRSDDGDTALVQSMLPLRSDVASGLPAPVDLSMQAGEQTFRPVNPLIKTVIPRNLNEGIAFPELGYSVRPSGAATTDPPELLEGKVHAANLVTDTDLLVDPTPTGVETTLIVRSADAPEESALQFEFRRGQTMRLVDGPTAKAIEIVEDGQPVAALMPPSAVDANGTPVPVTVELRADLNKAILHYPHRDQDFAYPIAVDPVIDNYQIAPGTFARASTTDPFLYWDYATAGPYPAYPWASHRGNAAYGNGLYVHSNNQVCTPDVCKPNTGFVADQNYAWWYWRAPAGSYITKAEYGWVRHDSNYSCLIEGIYGPSGWQAGTLVDPDGTVGTSPWQTNQGTNSKDACANQYDDHKTHTVTSPAGQYGNYMLFGLQAYYSFERVPPSIAYLYGAAITIDEKDPPTVSNTVVTGLDGSTLPTGWISQGTFRGTATVRDAGLGAKTLFIVQEDTPGDAKRIVARTDHTCTGGKDFRCPSTNAPAGRATEWNKDGTPPASLQFDLSTKTASGDYVVPDGVRTFRFRAHDVVDNASNSVGDFQLKIDRVAPRLTRIGFEGAGLASGSLRVSLQTSDATSGVDRVDALLDGQSAGSATCPSSCMIDLPANAAEGQRKLTFRTRDFAGNVSDTGPFQVTMSAGTPDLALSGTLLENLPALRTGDQTPYTLGLSASPARSTEASIDGLTRAATSDCSNSCVLNYSYDSAEFVAAPHLFNVTAQGDAGATSIVFTLDQRLPLDVVRALPPSAGIYAGPGDEDYTVPEEGTELPKPAAEPRGSTGPSPANGEFVCDFTGTRKWSWISSFAAGYVIGNCFDGWKLHRTMRSNVVPNEGRYEGGDIDGDFQGCGWVRSDRTDLDEPETGYPTCRALGEIKPNRFALVMNCAPSRSLAFGSPSKCKTATNATVASATPCPEFANLRPWVRGSAPTNRVDTETDAPPGPTSADAPGRIAWRYVTRYAYNVPGGRRERLVMSLDRSRQDFGANWVFIPLSCFELPLPPRPGFDLWWVQ
jgi:hypothetical protein